MRYINGCFTYLLTYLQYCQSITDHVAAYCSQLIDHITDMTTIDDQDGVQVVYISVSVQVQCSGLNERRVVWVLRVLETQRPSIDLVNAVITEDVHEITRASSSTGD